MLATIMGPDGLPNTTIDKPGMNKRGGGGRYTDHQYGFWSHDTEGPNTVRKITIDPKSNGGERAEVSIKGISDGKPMGAGPGGNFISDVEIRYTLGRDEPGLYTYSIFEHQPQYPASSLGEARFCAKLADFFDWMSVGPKWNKPYLKEAPGQHEDKYDFTADQFDNPAFGWSSTTRNVGFWLINPTLEYLSGGPTKVEFLCHRDTNEVQAPTVLNYWRSSHYGGAVVDVGAGRALDQGHRAVLDLRQLREDSAGRCATMPSRRPAGRARSGRTTGSAASTTRSGTSARPSPAASSCTIRRRRTRSWRTCGSASRIPPTHPTGFAHGRSRGAAPDRLADRRQALRVLDARRGERQLPHPQRAAGKVHAARDSPTACSASMRKPTSRRARQAARPGKSGHGRRCGTENSSGRSASRTATARNSSRATITLDDGMFLLYAKLFPNDVNYVIGKSDFRKDWFFEHVPHNENPDAKPAGYNMGPAQGRATPWSITFDLAQAPRGQAHLRLAICGQQHAGNRRRRQRPARRQGRPPVHRRRDRPKRNHGVWSERDVAFDASAMKAGHERAEIDRPRRPDDKRRDL